MKYLITESQLEKTIFKFIDMKDPYIFKTSHSYFFFTSRESMKDGESYIMKYDIEDEDCFISSDFARDVATMFSLHPDNTLSIISDWIENKLGVSITYYYSDFGFGSVQ